MVPAPNLLRRHRRAHDVYLDRRTSHEAEVHELSRWTASGSHTGAHNSYRRRSS
jgi:hypothetical protein